MKLPIYNFDPQPDTGYVYWVTGLPGAGKSTFARALNDKLKQAGIPSLLIDSDQFRTAIGDAFGFDRESRRSLGSVYGRLSALFSKQGLDIVCATTSLFDDVRRWNREHLPRYQEIYIQTRSDLIVQRHPRGLYARALEKRVRNVPGVDQYIEEPKQPDVVIDNTDGVTPGDLAATAARIAMDRFEKTQPGRKGKAL